MRGLVTTSNPSSSSSSLSTGVFLHLRHLFLLLLLLATFCTVGVHTTSLVEVEGVLGKEARMPCRIPPDFKGDIVYLILWYKEGVAKPIYSYDARGKVPRERAEETVLGGRAMFLPKEVDPTLVLTNLRENDEGLYTCRIDYKKKPTKRASVRLRVIIPPGTPSILLRESGEEVSGFVGPYEEGATVSLVCKVNGGRPSPNVTWYRDGQVLDDKIDGADVSLDRNPLNVVRNYLVLPPLLRENLHDLLKCSASNTLDTVPVSTTVQIDMTFPPLSVNILSSRAKLSAGRTYELTCRSVGARPAAQITWWLEGEQLEDATSEESNGGNETHSTLSFTPRADNEGEVLVCRAESPVLDAEPLEDYWQLDILYKPVVELRYGQTVEVDNLVEGEDFYFECLATAQPPVQKITWFLNGILLRTNVSAGVLESNHTLVLKKIQKHQSGLYTCIAANDEGEGTSDGLVLEVKYAPVCATDQVVTVGAARQETVSVDCKVKANPGQVDFIWAFNSSYEDTPFEEDLYNEGDLLSTLNYTVYNDSDYGTILCWASNAIGTMAEPCKIRLIPAGPPDAPINCTVTNQTTHTVNVACFAGYDGGLSQAFTVEVYDIATGKLAGNVTQRDLPIFTVQDLVAGGSFRVMVYSANAKGQSKEVALHGFTLPSPEPHPVSSTHIFPITPILGVLIGVIGALVIVAVVVVVVMRLRGDSNASRKMRPDAKRPTHKPLLPPKELEDNPDLIPSRTGDLGDGEILAGQRIPPKLKHANLYETVTFGENKDSSTEQPPTEDSGEGEVEYAELTFNTSKTAKNSKFKLPKKKEKNANGAVRPHEDSTIYATIDHARTEAHATTHPKKDAGGEVPASSRRTAGGNKKENGVCNGPVMADDGRTLDDIPLMDIALESSV